MKLFNPSKISFGLWGEMMYQLGIMITKKKSGVPATISAKRSNLSTTHFFTY